LIIRFVFGVVLLLLASREWRNRPKKGETPKMPKWLSFVDSFTPVKSFGLAVAMVGLNFKSLAAILSAAVKIEEANLSDIESAISMGVFVGIGSTTIGVPMALYLLKGEEVLKSLQKWRRWVERNSSIMLFAIESLLGVAFIGQGIGVFPT